MLSNFTKTVVCALALFVFLSRSAEAQVNPRTDAAKLIQGDWHKNTGDTGASAEVSFSFDSRGNVNWELAVTNSEGKRDARFSRGKYEISGNTVVMNYDDGGQDEFQFSVKDDVLTFLRDGAVFMEIDRVKNSRPESARITGSWYASATDKNGDAFAQTELLLRRGKFKMSIKLAAAGRTDVIEGDYRLEDGEIVLDSETGIERLPTRISRDSLEIEIVGARFILTRDGRNSDVQLLSQN